MGRNAGWLTASASLAKGADCEGVDMLFLPEIPFDLDSFSGQVKALMQNRKSLVIAVSEGIRLKDGRFVCELTSDSNAVDAFGHKMMQGAGKYLADFLHTSLGIKTRAIELNTPQRCAAHFSSRTDITESYNAGTAAVKAGSGGKERYCHYAGAYLHRSLSLHNLLSGCTQNCECGEKGSRRVD